MKHYVEYYEPVNESKLIRGIYYFGSDTSEEVQERDPSKIKIPEQYAGFRFFDMTDSGDRENFSRWYYQGVQLTIEQMKQENYDSKFIKWMEDNSIQSAVKVFNGNIIELVAGDTVLPIES